MIFLENEIFFGCNYFYSSDWGSLVDDIKEGWDNGYVITDIDYGDGVWLVVMSQVHRQHKQYIFTSRYFPEEEIKKSWKKNRWVTSITYDGVDWICVTTEMYTYCNQEYIVGPWNDCIDCVKKAWRSNRNITSITCKGGTYVFICSEFSSDMLLQQELNVLRSSDVTPKKIYDKCISGDRVITDMFNMSGDLVVITSRTENSSSQRMFSVSTENIRRLCYEPNEAFYNISAVAYFKGRWIFNYRYNRHYDVIAEAEERGRK